MFAAGFTHAIALTLKQTTPDPNPTPPRPHPLPGAPETPGADKRNLTPVIVGAAASGVAVLTGIGLLVGAHVKRSDAEALGTTIRSERGVCGEAPPLAFRAQCEELHALNSDHDTFQNLGVAALAIGGVALGATATYLVWPSSPPAPASAKAVLHAAPVVGPTLQGFVVHGAF